MSEARDPRELLALLAAKPQHFAVAPGGIPYTTPHDVAGALGMMSNPRAILYARIKYAGATQFLDELLSELWREATRLERATKLGRIRKDLIRDMCCIALWEGITGGACPWCKGVGALNIPPKRIVCTSCRGKGKRELRDTDLAEWLAVPKSTFSAGNYRDMYRDIATIVHRWDESIPGALYNRIRA